jgi:hypothetical protein
MSGDTDIIAMHDQAQAEIQQKARLVAAYYLKLRTEGLDDYDCLQLALAVQQRILFDDETSEAS